AYRALLDNAEKRPIEQRIYVMGGPAIEQGMRLNGLKYGVVLCPSHLCLRLDLVNSAVSASMAARKIIDHAQCGQHLALRARREFPEHVPQRCVHIGLVDRHPLMAEIREAGHNSGSKFFKPRRSVAMQKSPELFKPRRMSEMV